MKQPKKIEIIYPTGVVKKLAERYKVSERSVRYALKFVTKSDTADAIRKDCIKEFGGQLTEISVEI